MKRKMHLAFNLSYTHMNGRWNLPGSWDERTFPTRRCMRTPPGWPSAAYST